MIHDQNCIFSDKQAVTATAASTNEINIMEMLGKGEPVRISVQVTEDFATCTDLNVKLQQADTEGGSYEDVNAGETIAVADLVAGKKYGMQWLARNVTKPWVRLYYTVGGSNATAGTLFAVLAPYGVQDSYESGQFIDRGIIN